MALATGTRLGRYEIRSLIGKGGMGEIYLAQDTELERAAALKLLPAEVASDRQRMQRFIQEAKAISALNHPNILTIYEVGQADSSRFIATEFIEGETLRQHMSNGRMKLGEVLDIAAQVAAALAAAHAAGIAHRDIKPENIMLRRDGYIKVLDFGLAKLTEHPASQSGSSGEAPTLAIVDTEPGLVMGTIKYMSPEQARGLTLDTRTDLWSLGCVFYEMITGRVPFEGATTSDVLVAILEREPVPLVQQVPDLPSELQRIVRKALRKEREERYQTAKDLALDLKNLRRELEMEAEREYSVQPASSSETPSVSGVPAGTEGARQSAASSTGVAELHPTTSAEYIVSGIKRHRRGVTAALAALGLLSVVGIFYFFYSARSGKAIDSIAVLPFVNASGDPDTEYLSDGISEALINSLTELQQLRVVARTTAFRYKGREIDPQAAGRELNVRAVLTGRVRHTGGALNIQVDLVDATTGAQLWGTEYERQVSDVLSIKQTIAREVTEKLRLRLSGEEQRRLVRRDTTNAEAYEFYLRGRYYWNKRTADGLRKAIEQFQQAIERDPTYALGFVGLADCYLVLEQYAGTPASETLPKAKAAVLRALQIDDSLAESHTSLADLSTDLWQWGEAEKEYKRAIELNPNYPTVHHWYSLYLVAVGRLSESMAEIKRAQEIDPFSPVISVNVVGRYFQQGDLNAALEQCRRIIELDPNYPETHLWLGLIYQKQGRYAEAIVESQKGVELSGREGFFLGALGQSYALAGKRAEALATLRELEEKYTKGESNGANLAWVYTGLGEKDQAFAWLEKDYQAHSGHLAFYIKVFPVLDPLRSDARYTDLLRRMGLPQ